MNEASLSTLPVGTQFYVNNGAWHGKIIEVSGEKRILVEETGQDYPIDDNHGLDITIEGEDTEPDNKEIPY